MKDLTITLTEVFKTKEEYAFLVSVTKLNQSAIPEIREVLNSLYHPARGLSSEDKLNSKLMATWLNAILTQKRFVFMNTYRDFSKLVAKDKNLIKRKSVSFEEFKSFNHHLLFNKYINIVRDPSEKGHGKTKSGVYEVAHSAIETLLSKTVQIELKQAQMEQCIEIYDEKKKTSRTSSLKTSRSQEYEVSDVPSSGLSGEQSQEETKPQPKVEPSASVDSQNANASSNNPKSQTPSSVGRKPKADDYSSIPLATKLDLLLVNSTFADMISSDEKKLGYYEKFQNFRDLLVAKNKLSEAQASMVNDWFAKVKKEEKKNLIYDYATILDEMEKSHISVGPTVWIEDIEYIYDIMVDYFMAPSGTEDEKKAIKDKMVNRIDAYGEKQGYENDPYWILVTAMWKKYNGNEEYLKTILEMRNGQKN